MEEILLNQKQVDTLMQHSEKAGVTESCAMLFGIHSNQQWNVKEVFLTRNSYGNNTGNGSPETNFIIAPEQLLEGYQLAEKKQLELVGIFHSHPNSAASPSNMDKKFMKVNPVPWIIYSGVTKEMKAYLLDSDLIQIPIE